MCYNRIMEKTEIEELIEQAEAIKKKWRKPEVPGRPSDRTWQEVLDNKPYPHLRVGNL